MLRAPRTAISLAVILGALTGQSGCRSPASQGCLETRPHVAGDLVVRIESVALSHSTCEVVIRILSTSSDVISIDTRYLDGLVSSGLRFWHVLADDGYWIHPGFPIASSPPTTQESRRITLAPGSEKELRFTWPVRHGGFLRVDRYGEPEGEFLESLPCGVYAVDFQRALRIARGESRVITHEFVLSSNKFWLKVPEPETKPGIEDSQEESVGG